MSGFYGVLVGTGTTSVGIVLGSLLERWRDNTRWKREEQARWSGDLRLLYRDLLASGDEFFSRLGHTRMLEGRAKKEHDISEREGERLVRLMTDSLDAMERESKRVLEVVAEVELIGSEAESDATARFGIVVLAGTVLSADEDFHALQTQYKDAKKAVVAVARSSLRRV